MRQRKYATGTILLFVDDAPWISFNQMAARLRHRECQTMRVTCDRSITSRMSNILLYKKSCIVDSWSHLPPLDDLVAHRGEIIDIQCPEPLLHIVDRWVTHSKVVGVTALARLHQRVELGDKLTAMNRLHDAQVRVPLHVDDATSTIDGAIAELGLPLVIKPRHGAAGTDVVVVKDMVAALLAASRLASPGDTIFEEYIDGEQLGFCSVFQNGEVLQEAAFERMRYDVNSSTNADVLRTFDDEPLFALGRRIITVIGGSGFIDLDILRNQSGQDFVVDLNLRASGSLGALLRAGVDFSTCYLDVMSATTTLHGQCRAVPGVELKLSLRPRRDSNLSAQAVHVLIASYHRIRDFGIRYWINELLSHASVTLAAARADKIS